MKMADAVFVILSCCNIFGDLCAAIALFGTQDGVPVEEFELDLDHVVEALDPLVDVLVAAVTAVHFAGGLSPHQ
jgi:hypothetical protein